MGCDIHLHTEIKLNGKWEHYSNPQINRWYGLFAKMAGVRQNEQNFIDPISPAKGLPEDVSAITKFEADRWGSDGHSHSWLDATEIAALIRWVDQQNTGIDYDRWERRQLGYLCDTGWGDWAEYPDGRERGIEDIRFVFWFDN